MLFDALDYHLIHEDPAPLYMGELPRRWEDVPARVVVNLCGVFPGGEPFGRIVHGFALIDALDPEVMPERRQFEQFLHGIHSLAANEASYWHCHAGINRSGLAVAAYLHLHRGLRISTAIEIMRERRSEMVLCNSAFERQLRDWYGQRDERTFSPFSFETWRVERLGKREGS